jgi:lipopolysaccharide export system protein LptA
MLSAIRHSFLSIFSKPLPFWFWCIVTLAFSSFSIFAQQQEQRQTVAVASTQATLLSTQATLLSTQATLLSTQGTIEAESTDRSKSGIDTVVNYAAKDSIVYSVKKRKLRLRGEAYVKNKAQTLQAEVIELFFDQSTMRAQGGRDSTGRFYGEPVFVDGSEKYLGETISYNFKNKRGTVSMAQTDLGEGYYFGDRIKRISENTLYVQDGCYTTCNKGHPHFYFKSPRMKVITQDRIFVDQLLVYVEDIPIFYLPFSVFIPNDRKDGRRSGVLLPTIDFPSFGQFENSRGVVFRNFGYYWAVNDYFDTQLTADVFTKGGFLLRNTSRYNLNGYFNGELSLSYGSQRFNTLADFQTNWSVSLSHRQVIDPQTNISASLQYTSPNFNRSTQIDVLSRAQQVIRSNASVSRSFDNGMSVNVSYARQQNLITSEATDDASLNFNLGQFFPLKSLVPSDSWLSQGFAITYNPAAQVQFYRSPDATDSVRTAELRREGVVLATTSTVPAPVRSPFVGVVRHNPAIALQLPRIGFFNVSFSPQYTENWYFRRIKSRTIDTVTGFVNNEFEYGLFREYAYSATASIATTLYGIVQPRILGLNALRHTVQPSLSYSFTPSFLNNPDLFDVTLDSITGQRNYYSRFEADGGGVNRFLSQSIVLSVNNNFEAKVATSDTSEKTIQLLNVGLGMSYNMAADSFQLSNIALNVRTSAGIIDFSGAASFDPYQRTVGRVPFSTAEGFIRQNRFMLAQGVGLMRLTSLNFAVSTQFSPATFNGSSTPSSQTPQPLDTTAKNITDGDNAQRERFRQRMDTSVQRTDIFGEDTPGFAPINIPWNVGLSANFNYNEPNAPNARALFSAGLNANMNFTIENSWRVTANLFYDVLNGQQPIGSFTVTKDIHCWDLSLNWQPFGLFQSFSFRLGIKASQLRDLQIRRQNSPFVPQ